MKIALIIPQNAVEGKPSFYDYRFYKSFLFSDRYFSYLLAAPVLASLTPPEHEVRIFDENIEEIDFEWEADLVGISVRTMFAKRAYAIARTYRERGVKTVLGGIHPSMCTDEALEHCDAVVKGEAEHTWPTLLEDFQNGTMQRVYNSKGFADLRSYPGPDRSKLSRNRYFVDIVQTTKGCPFDCEFCSVSAFDGQMVRSKAVNQVLNEILTILETKNQFKKKSIFFADDNIIANKKYARELFTALKPHNLNWSCQGSINVSQDDEMLTLMKEAGCGAIFVGLESVSEKNLAAMGKKVNLRHDYFKAIEKIQDHGILVLGSFILGYDFDTPESFDELIGFIEEANLLMPLINILTPFPGTKLYRRLEEEGRILHRNWNDYDSQTVVFRPAGMTPEELFDGFRKVVREVYSFESIYRKLDRFWQIDFWRHSNETDPIKFRYRLLFAARLASLLLSPENGRSEFIMRLLPRVFEKKVRISTIVTLMAHNNFAYSI
ncbi:MAG: radical SAM protein [Desulfobacteria bacterium]